MKRALLSHPKTNDLASRLGCNRPAAIGYLALLFDFCAEHSPQGDIGKWVNGAIAKACEWSGDADLFIDSLVKSKWLDEHDTHRLLIHDWQTNCDNWVRAKVKNMGVEFCSLGATYVDTKEASYVGTKVDTKEASKTALTISVGKDKGKGKEKKEESPRFQKPSIGEVTAYCQERGKGVDPEAWLDHYESNGWKVGKNHMVDWKAAVRTWERTSFSTGKPEQPKQEVAYRDPNRR